MKPFHTLTYRGQVRRLRQVAHNALLAYDLPKSSLRLIHHGENTIFRMTVANNNGHTSRAGIQRAPHEHDVRTRGDYAENQFVLRIHRPTYQDVDSIRSELTWLAALRSSGIIVPEPIPTVDGALASEGCAPGVPGVRVCSLLRWVNGRFVRAPAFRHFSRLGTLMAQLHEHTRSWIPPAGFRRRHWNGEGLFGNEAGFVRPAVEVWSRVPENYAAIMQQVVIKTEQMMDRLGQGPAVWGLVHADLHLDNVLFARDAARAIDFDDCGYGYWLYDLAVVLAEYADDDNWVAIRSALFDGYTQIRPLPDQIEQLPMFMAARYVSLLLWATDMAGSNPRFAVNLPAWYAWGMGCIERLEHLPS